MILYQFFFNRNKILILTIMSLIELLVFFKEDDVIILFAIMQQVRHIILEFLRY